MTQPSASGGQNFGALASASILPMNNWDEFPLGLTSLNSLPVQGTLKSLLQHHSSKASNLHCSAFFRVQLSHSYTATEKHIAVTIWTFVGKVISLLFNVLSKFVITLFPRSKCLLILWLKTPSAVILEPRKIKYVFFSLEVKVEISVSTFSPSVCHEMMGIDAIVLVF